MKFFVQTNLKHQKRKEAYFLINDFASMRDTRNIKDEVADKSL